MVAAAAVASRTPLLSSCSTARYVTLRGDRDCDVVTRLAPERRWRHVGWDVVLRGTWDRDVVTLPLVRGFRPPAAFQCSGK